MKSGNKIKRRIIKGLEATPQKVDEHEDEESMLRRAEEQLRNREEKYRHIYENIQDIYYEIGVDGIILELSPSIEKLTKYRRIELIGKSVYEIYAYPEEREEFLKVIKETGIVTDFEITMKDKDGRLLTGSLCSRLVLNERGEPHKIIGTMRDVTKRKLAEEALRESEEKYRSVVDNIGIGISLISPNMEILALNNQMKRWFPDIDIFRKPICYKAFNNPPRETACSYCPTYKTLQDGNVHESVTETPAERDIRNYRIISSPIKDKDGKVIAAIEMVDDITETIKAQAELKESEIKYRSIFETTAAATIIIDEDTIISLVNTDFEKLSGYTKKEIEGRRSWTEFVAKDDLPKMQEYHRLRRIDPMTAPRNYEFRFINRTGDIRNAFMTIAMIPGTTKSVASLLDITDIKHVEEALRESEQRLSDIIDFLPDATFAIDLNGKVIAWNRAIEVMTGIRAPDMLGKGDYEYALPFYEIRRPILIDMIFRFDEEIKEQYLFVKKEGDVLLAERNATLKGEIRALSAKASPLYDSRGNMVGAIESIRDITERRRAEKALEKREGELEVKSRNLEELNTALKVLLKQREADKDELEERTMTNVKHLVLPYIEKLKKSSLETKDTAYIGIIESNLKDIISPFSHRLSSKYMTFTPKELQVANLIKEGKTTKDIAELLNASPGTIDFHRNNIRKKLNLKNRRANLRSYLLTLS